MLKLIISFFGQLLTMKIQRLLEQKQNFDVKTLFKNIFQRKKPEQSSAEIEKVGGLSYLFNELNVSHREGLSRLTDQEINERKLNYGANVAPKGQSILRKSIDQQRDFMVNMLFYILTLMICIKILMWRNGLQTESIIFELTCFLLLFVIVYLKAQVNVEYFRLNQDQSKYQDQKLVRVKRDGQKKLISEKELLVGDIIIVEPKTTIRVDGIVVYVQDKDTLNVCQDHTILRGQFRKKCSYWKKNDENYDPFILAGSTITSGTGQMLVCQVGEQCSFRSSNNYQTQKQFQTPVIQYTKKLLQYAQMITKVICLLFAIILSLAHLYKRYYYQAYDPISQKDFIVVLKIFAAFIGIACIQQKLKVVRSLTFFLEGNIFGRYYRVLQKKAFQLFSQVDTIFIEESIISKTIQLNPRDSQRPQIYKIRKQSILEEINRYFNIKIVTDKTAKQMSTIYQVQLSNTSQFYFHQQDSSSQQDIENLIKATFIVKCSTKKFINDILPIYNSFQSNVAYISNIDNKQSHDIPASCLHICFKGIQSNQTNFPKSTWIKVQNQMYVQNVLKEIVIKSFTFSKLHNAYLCLTLNNFCILMVLTWLHLDLNNIKLNLAWCLGIIIINRYTFLRIYRRLAIECTQSFFSKRSFIEYFKFNSFLLAYYLYAISNIEDQIGLFLFFVANSMLRVQCTLFKILPKKSLRQILRNTLIIVGMNLLHILWSRNWESIQTFIFTMGIVFLFQIYILIA